MGGRFRIITALEKFEKDGWKQLLAPLDWGFFDQLSIIWVSNATAIITLYFVFLHTLSNKITALNCQFHCCVLKVYVKMQNLTNFCFIFKTRLISFSNTCL